MTAVNQARTSEGLVGLTQSDSLDQFAAVRLQTSTTGKNWEITHYGIDHDASCFFVNCIPYSELGSVNSYVLNQNALNAVLGNGAYYQLPSGWSSMYWQMNLGGETVYFTTESAISTYVSLTYGKYTSVTFSPSGSFVTNFPTQPGEVVFFPDGYSPSSYVSSIQSQAPLHWSLLIDTSLTHYGFAIGQGETLSVYQPCPVSELPGPNINVTRYYAQYGCQTLQEPTTWLVIDMT